VRRALVAAIGLNLLFAAVALATHQSDARPFRVLTLPPAPAAEIPETAPEVTVPTTIAAPAMVPKVRVPHVTVPPVVKTLVAPVVPPFEVSALGLWLVDADRKAGRLLVGDLAPTNVCFSADGKQAVVPAFADPPYDGAKPITMYVVDVQSGARRVIAPGAHAPGGCAWSPDGTWIAYNAQPDTSKPIDEDPTAPAGPHGVSELWLIRPDGTDNHRVAVVDGSCGRLAWSRDSSRFTAPLFNDGRVLVFDLNAGTEHRWTFPRPYLIDWDRGGTRLVVSSDEDPTELMDPSTGARTPFASDAHFPRWSPAADQIAVRRGTVAGVLTLGGLVFKPLGPGSPLDWSTDGKSIDYQDGTSMFSVGDVTTGLSRVVATVSNPNWSLSPTVWLPGSRQVAVIAEPNAAFYMP
jgi:Tol biopolymer transport system component